MSTAQSQNLTASEQETQQNANSIRKLLMGPGVGELNLKTVKERGMALRKSIEELIDILQFQPQLLTWRNSVERFGAITARHQQLTDKLNPLLKFYIARPLSVTQSNAEVIPVLLSTMQLPEMAKEDADILGDHQNDVAATGLVQLYKQLQATIEGFNKIIDDMTKNGKTSEESGYLNSKGGVQQGLTSAIHQAATSGKVGPDESAEAKALIAAATTGEGL